MLCVCRTSRNTQSTEPTFSSCCRLSTPTASKVSTSSLIQRLSVMKGKSCENNNCAIIKNDRGFKCLMIVLVSPFFPVFVYFTCTLRFDCVFAALLNIPPAQFKLVLDSIIWAFKHTMRNVADTGLDILYTLLQNIAGEEVAAQSFYQTYFTDILQHLFSVITDSSHTAGQLLDAVHLQLLFVCVDDLGWIYGSLRIFLKNEVLAPAEGLQVRPVWL